MLNITQITSQFKQAMQVLYGERLDKVILYGSYAKNEATEDSDLDLLVVLKDEEISAFKEIDKIVDVTFDLNLKYNLLISTQPMSSKQYTNGISPLLYFIRKEGIVL